MYSVNHHLPPPTDHPVVCEHCLMNILCRNCAGCGSVLIGIRIVGSSMPSDVVFDGPVACQKCGGLGLDSDHQCHPHQRDTPRAGVDTTFIAASRSSRDGQSDTTGGGLS